ncbi:MAG: peptidoglycan-binding protein [Clostridia bacterium]|nr:peptidoglycan-binding protein [Clostridia bacterium]
MAVLPVIPNNIIVHLGPPDANVANVSVSFPDYIKNVASSEIYPTWPDAAIRANVLAQISFALNRVYTEYYRSRGYDFDITNSTVYDQAFIYGRDIFENVGIIVDQIFNDYIVRRGSVEPLLARYCNGTTTQCDGLSQWGSVELANQGLYAYDILTRYYGDDIDLVFNAPVADITPSDPKRPLKIGSAGNDVSFVQLRLNRIGQNYPSIPKISPVDGIFGTETDRAVREFQRIFNLTVDGIVGRATWYRIQYIYNAVKRLNELNSEGLTIDEVSGQFAEKLEFGDRGNAVRVIQYYLRVIAEFSDAVLSPPFDGYYGYETMQSVLSFQREYSLPETGVIDRDTWYAINDVYRADIGSVSDEMLDDGAVPFPGIFLKYGARGSDVEILQRYLNAASAVYPNIPPIEVNGVFDEDTRDAVYSAQSFFGYQVNGIVGPLLWDRLSGIYVDVNQHGNM